MNYLATTMKKFIQLISLAFLSLAAFAADTSTPPALQIRLVADVASSDSDEMIVAGKSKDPSQQDTLHVLKKILIDQTDLKSAKVTKDNQLGPSQIEITFTDPGKKRFAEGTRESIGKRLAIVIGGRLYSAPTIRTEVSGGTAVISGNFSEEEATELVNQITKSLKK